jgi:hypothetical protein
VSKVFIDNQRFTILSKFIQFSTLLLSLTIEINIVVRDVELCPTDGGMKRCAF